MNILIVDDEKLFIKGLQSSLQKEGYTVFVAYDGKEGLELLGRRKVDLILLDIMLPAVDGVTFLKKIRTNSDIPVIMLTARDDYADMVLSLELGADDYVTKPFNTRVLIARIKSALRRSGFKETKAGSNNDSYKGAYNGVDNGSDNGSAIMKQKETVIGFGGLSVSIPERSVYKRGKEIVLTAREFDILEAFIKNRGTVLTREQIYDLVWHELDCDTRTVDVHISKLREKIEDDPKNPAIIMTKWGVGYYLKKDRS